MRHKHPERLARGGSLLLGEDKAGSVETRGRSRSLREVVREPRETVRGSWMSEKVMRGVTLRSDEDWPPGRIVRLELGHGGCDRKWSRRC